MSILCCSNSPNVINRIKETLRKKFADAANNLERQIRETSGDLAAIEGPLELQQERVHQVQTQLPDLTQALRVVEQIEEECQAANVEENDYTVFTVQDLVFELELVVQSISKKIAFIDNQVCRLYPYVCVYCKLTNFLRLFLGI